MRTYLVDGVAYGEICLSLAAQSPSMLLHQCDHHRAISAVVVHIAAGDCHVVLRVCPERRYAHTHSRNYQTGRRLSVAINFIFREPRNSFYASGIFKIPRFFAIADLPVL